MMNSRERFFTTLKHMEPDRVPYNARLCKELLAAIREETAGSIDYRDYYKEDIYFVEIEFPEYLNRSLDYLPIPEKASIEKAKEDIERLKDKGVVVCNTYIPGVYEHVKEFIGDEAALIGMYEEPDDLKQKIKKVAEWLVAINEINAKAGFDICWIGDDIGAQNSLIMSPDCYREFYKPYHRELVQRIKGINPDAKVAFHCCGHVVPLIPELMEIGVDILETLQPEANNDLKMIKSKYGKDITFWGAIGMQSVFFNRSPEEVREEVCLSLRIMAAGGGYIAAPCHTVTKDMTVGNVKAFYEAVIAYGEYPTPGM